MQTPSPPPIVDMADSDDDMPPLEYVGTVPPAANPPDHDDDDMPPLEYVGTVPPAANPPDDDDDDMPPLEYVGADASLGISLREGDRVILKGLSKTALNGQTGTLQSFQKASKGRLPVKLDQSGSMLAVKPENIEKHASTQAAKAADLSRHGVACAKATHVDRNGTAPPDDDDDDELPPLEYVGATNGATNGASTGVKDLSHANGKPEDEDDMPSLEYFGASKAAAPAVSSAPSPPKAPYAEARARGGAASASAVVKEMKETKEPTEPQGSGTFRPGDQVLIRGTDKILDGQQGIIESIGQDGFCQVKMEKNNQLVRLGQGNLHKIWLRGSGAGAMPPLQTVGQANGCAAPMFRPRNLGGAGAVHEVARLRYSAVNGQEAQSKPERSRPTETGNQEAQDALKAMRSALGAASLQEVDAALRLAEKPGVAWGQWEMEKTQMVKQLRATRSRLDADPQVPQVPQASGKSTIEKWCEELQLPQELLARLREEDVRDPQELTGVGEEELAALTSGLKIGPKGRLIKAVKRMKALEAAELGSTVSMS